MSSTARSARHPLPASYPLSPSLHRSAASPDRPPRRPPTSTAAATSTSSEFAFYVSTFHGIGADDGELRGSNNKQKNKYSRDPTWLRWGVSE